MNTDEGFLTIKNSVETKTKEKGSLFIGLSFSVESIEEAHIILEKIRKNYYDATHYCYALILADGTVKYSDDGEPPGTAGIRIRNAIQHFSLRNVLVVVVRYFGGTKLGTGLLGKTYYTSVENNLSQSEFVEYIKYERLRIYIEFNDQGIVYKIFNNFSCIILDSIYQERLSIGVLVKPSISAIFKQNLTDITKGRIEIISYGSIYYHK